MNTWLQLAVAVVSLAAGGLGAYQQVRKRLQPLVSSPHGNDGRRPGLNGFAVILRQAMDQIDQLRRENEQLRIRVAELEARAAERSTPRRARSSTSKAAAAKITTAER
jgi:hypothetical protein